MTDRPHDPAARRRGRVALWAVLAGWAAFLWLWTPAYLALTVDDSFYYLQIARNLAEGHGLTFDRLQPTNGFHPLWLFTITPLAWLPGDALPVLAVLTLQLLLVLGGLDLMARALAPRLPHVELVAAVLLLNPYAFKILVNGQESALLFFLLCSATALLASHGPAQAETETVPPTRLGPVVSLPLLGAAVALTRPEGVIFGLALVLVPLVWPAPGPGGEIPPWHRRWPATVLSGAIFAIPVLAWGVFSLVRFGHPLPVSAVIKAEWYGASAGMFASGLLAAAGVTVAAFFFARWLASTTAGPVLRSLLPLFACAAAVAAVHRAVRGTWLIFEIWYLAPFFLLGLVALAALVRTCASALGWRRWAALIAAIALGTAHLALAVPAWGHRLDPLSYSTYLAAQRTGVWLRENTSPEEVMAGWDVGIVAWHARRRLMNLEGLVASWEFKESYLDPQRLEELITWVEPVDLLVQPFWLPWLERAREQPFHGVELAAWGVVRAECVEFRPAVPGSRPRQRVHLVLEPPGGVAPPLATLDPTTELCPAPPAR